MNTQILQNADVLLIGATLIPVVVQFLKDKLPKFKPQLISFVVSFAFALIVLLVSVGIEAGSIKELAPQALAIALAAWRWADGTYRTIKPPKVDKQVNK